MGSIISIDGFKNFKCIGSKCSHTCCSGWAINLTKSDYKRLKNLGIDIQHNASIFDKDNNLTYARMKVFADTKNCAFLDENNLCKIQKAHGHEAIPYICRIYPRIYKKLNKSFEIGLSLSCPEVIKNYVFNGEVKFIQTTGHLNQVTSDFCLTEDLEQLYLRLQFIGLEILSLDSFLILERLYMIKFVYSEFYKNIKAVKNIDKALDISIANLYSNLDNILKEVKDLGIKNVLNLINGLLNYNISKDFISKIENSIYKYLNDNIDNYYIALQQYYKFEKDNSLILTNLFKIIFYNYFNFDYNKFINFIINYFNIYMVSIGFSLISNEFSLESLTDLIVTLERAITHDTSKIKYLSEYNLNS